MTTAQINNIKTRISNTLQAHAGVAPARTVGLLTIKDIVGKLYEAEVLAKICEDLVQKEGLSIKFVGSGNLTLRQKGGPVNRVYPYFQVYRGDKLIGELFTDIYFNTLSSTIVPTRREQYGDYHELDIALLKPGVSGKPNPDEILLAVECKNTTIKKSIIRELLGLRRELSYFVSGQKTEFNTWPASTVNANPASLHMLYTTHSDAKLNEFRDNCNVFGIELIHHKM